jgi:hypothetical protein
MIELIKEAALEVGVSAVFTNSYERIETQLNALTREEDSPVFLISWDIDTVLSFDSNGFLENPSSVITALLVKKAESMKKNDLELASQQMGSLFQLFLQKLYDKLIPFQRSTSPSITNASYKLVPAHGAGKHSGVLCKWTMNTEISNTVNC